MLVTFCFCSVLGNWHWSGFCHLSAFSAFPPRPRPRCSPPSGRVHCVPWAVPWLSPGRTLAMSCDCVPWAVSPGLSPGRVPWLCPLAVSCGLCPLAVSCGLSSGCVQWAVPWLCPLTVSHGLCLLVTSELCTSAWCHCLGQPLSWCLWPAVPHVSS